MVVHTSVNSPLAVSRTLLHRYMTEAATAVSDRRAELGEKIRQARKAKPWKQRQLAAAVHVQPMTVSRWERGENSPDIDMLLLIAEALGQPIGFFVDDLAPEGYGSIREALVGMDEKLSEVLRRLPEAETPPQVVRTRR